MNDIGGLKEEFPDKYLFAEDLQNKAVTLTIEAINKDVLVTTKGKKNGIILTFKGAKKLFVLNKTNASLINEIFPVVKSLREWQGKRITIFPTQCQLGGETVDCIRVWGSPDLPADKEVMVKAGLKRVAWKLHAVKAGAPTAAVANGEQSANKTSDVREKQEISPTSEVIDAWDILGWTTEERKDDGDRWHGGCNHPTYLTHLGALIDQMNAQEAS